MPCRVTLATDLANLRAAATKSKINLHHALRLPGDPPLGPARNSKGATGKPLLEAELIDSRFLLPKQLANSILSMPFRSQHGWNRFHQNPEIHSQAPVLDVLKVQFHIRFK